MMAQEFMVTLVLAGVTYPLIPHAPVLPRGTKMVAGEYSLNVSLITNPMCLMQLPLVRPPTTVSNSLPRNATP